MKNIFVIWFFLLCTCSVSMGQDNDYYKVRRSRISNNNNDERSPVPLGDSLIVYASNMTPASANPLQQLIGTKGESFFYLYVSKKNDRGGYSKGKELMVNSGSKLGASNPGFAKEASMMVFSQFYSGRRIGEKSVGIFIADKVGEGYGNVRPFEHNDPEYVLFTPSISEDGNTLYFAANFEDAIGAYDIYVSSLNNGNWSKPENLGRAINTENTELYPFFHPIGRLFFTSDGFDTRGGFDIFQSDYIDKDWTSAEKIPYNRINSSNDDYALVMGDDFESGYFERQGATYDIYEFTTDIPVFKESKKFKSNYHRRFLLKDNSFENDTIDPELYDLAWVIDDTLRLQGSEVIHAFPGPGEYNVRFEVYDKLLDSTRIVLNREQVVSFRIQAAITCPDTVIANVEFPLDAKETYLPDLEIEQYYWDFSDGLKDEGIQTRHTYKYPGTYTVILGVKERVANKRDVAEMRSNYKEVVVLPAR